MQPRLTKSEYEHVVLRLLRRRLIEQDPGLWRGGKIRVEEVRVDTSRTEHMLEIFFRADARPMCLFGWRFPAVDFPEEDYDRPASEVTTPRDWPRRGQAQAEIWAETFVITNFEEQIEARDMGLPPRCDPDGVTWIGKYKP